MAGNSSFTSMLGHWARVQGDETAVTFLDHRASADGLALSLTWRELDERVTAVALHAGGLAARGERAAILVGQSLDYVVAFLGAIRAGLVAVPLFAPSLPGHGDRLVTVLGDCAPALVLTTDAERDDVKGLVSGQEILVVDEVPAEPGDRDWPVPDPDDLAYLQYTSGSTRSPAGVMLTHRNVVTNARQALRAYGGERTTTSAVSWLPLYHDMGLILGIGAPVVGGLTSVLMDPVAFLERPERWLREVVFTEPGEVPRTSSGKISRTLCRRQYLEGSLDARRLA